MFVRDSCSKQLDSDRLAADVPEDVVSLNSEPKVLWVSSAILLHLLGVRGVYKVQGRGQWEVGVKDVLGEGGRKRGRADAC